MVQNAIFKMVMNLRTIQRNLYLFLLGSLGTEELRSFFSSLESTVTHLGGGIDELKVDLFKSSSTNLGNQTLSQDEGSLLGTNTATLDEDEIFSDDTVVRETTQRSDGLFGQISSSRGVVSTTFVLDTNTDSVDLLVHFSSVVVTQLTSSGNGESYSGRMPSSDTSDLSETSMGLSGKSLGSESGGDTFVTLTLSNTEDINHFVLVDDLGDSDFLFKVLLSEVNLLSDGTTVNLDFEDVSLLLSKVELIHLSVDDDSDDLTVFLDSVKLTVNVLGITPLLAVLVESLLLGVHPVLIESSLQLSRQVLSPDGSKSSETSGGFNVTNNTANNDGRSFEDGTSFDDFLLVELGADLVDISEDVGHTSLEDGESGKVDGLRSIILGVASYSTSMMSSSLSGKETEGTVSGSFELSVRHDFS